MVFAHHPAERVKHGPNQLIVEPKYVMKILRIELEGVHRLQRGNRVHRWRLIERGKIAVKSLYFGDA